MAASAATGAGAAPSAPASARYIVTVRDNVDVESFARGVGRRDDSTVDHVYTHALRGFAGRMSAASVASLRSNPGVVRVEADGVAHTTITQTSAPWGLDRSDQRNRPLSTTYVYQATGLGVHAYVIDTGIKLNHGQFTGRIGTRFDAVKVGGTANDCNGHGTHVAGTIGGTKFGIAKKVTLHPVRVLSCNGGGLWSWVLAGIDWVTANHVKPAVANMSLGGPATESVDEAIRTSIAAGVTYAVAAGNDGGDACLTTPARVPEALTIGATNKTDAVPTWSSRGLCVDLFAPGVDIQSAYIGGTWATARLSGTSMATPHVSGVVAQHLQASPAATPAEITAAIGLSSTPDKLTGTLLGAPNSLLYTAVTLPP